MTTCATNKPLVFGPDPLTFRVCSFLVNVLSNMYDQWKTAGKPGPDRFNWQPIYSCLVPTELKVTEYDFFPLIWSTYTWIGKINATEPFGCFVKSKADGNLYLVFRGSKTVTDFCLDVETSLVGYKAPTRNPPPNIQVEQGWYKVYNGISQPLPDQLKQIGESPIITITGHSLGSAIATLVVPDFVAAGFQVHHYNTASPMVGDYAFREYYESLELIDSSRGLLTGTFRLVNTADTVPNFPSAAMHPRYVHVGTEVSFNADYGNEEKTHNPCCSYAYAIHHPDNPCNSTFDECNVPIN